MGKVEIKLPDEPLKFFLFFPFLLYICLNNVKFILIYPIFLFYSWNIKVT